MANLRLSNSKLLVTVDDEDLEKVIPYIWCFNRQNHTIYIQANIGNNKTIEIHQLILEYKEGFVIDHKNHNRLDNRKENLRYATKSQDLANRRLQLNNKSGYKGVSWIERDKRWQATIQINGISKYIGFYKTKEEAALAYNKRATSLFGEFAYLNIIKEDNNNPKEASEADGTS